MNKEDIKKYTKNYKSKIENSENLKDFLENFSKDQLLKKISTASLTKKIDYSYFDYLKLEKKTKKEIIKVFIANYYGIYNSILIAINNDYIKEMIYLVRKENNFHQEKFENDYFEYSIGFLDYLNSNLIAAVNFNDENDLLTIKVPDKIGIYIKKIFNNSQFVEKNRDYNLVRERINWLLSPYYVLSERKLYTFYIKNFTNHILSEDEFHDLLYELSSDNWNIFIYYNSESESANYLVSDEHFSTNSPHNFYNTLAKFPYKEFSIDDYSKIYHNHYHERFKPFIELKHYFIHNLSFTNDDFKYFNEEYLPEYITRYNIEDEEYLQELQNTLKEEYDLSQSQSQEFFNILSKLSRLCPSYKLKGYAIDEDLIEENLC